MLFPFPSSVELWFYPHQRILVYLSAYKTLCSFCPFVPSEPPHQDGSVEEEPEPPQIKDIQVEFWTRQEVEHFLETDSFLMPKSRCEETSGVCENSRVRFQKEPGGQSGPVQRDPQTSGMELCDSLTPGTHEKMVITEFVFFNPND